MGEAVAARAVVQGVDNDNYTPKLYQVAMKAVLATGDPAGLCPLAEPRRGGDARARLGAGAGDVRGAGGRAGAGAAR